MKIEKSKIINILSTVGRDKIEKWKISMTNKDIFVVSNEFKSKIVNSQTQLLELPNGEIINKAHIVSIRIEKYKEPEPSALEKLSAQIYQNEQNQF